MKRIWSRMSFLWPLFLGAAIALGLIIYDRLARAQEAPKQQPAAAKAQPATKIVAPVLLHNELNAVTWVYVALLAYEEPVRPYMRFAVLPPYADATWHDPMNVAVNLAAGHAGVLIKADLHADGWLMAWNLLDLAGGDPAKYERLKGVWDELAVRESKFHVPDITVEQVKVGKDVKETKHNIARLAPHLGEALARHATEPEKSQRVDALVTAITNSTGAIYPADFLLEQLLTSVRGKYPEFIQLDFKLAEGDKRTPIQALLQSRGYFTENSKLGKGDRAIILIQSDVTGKTRIIWVVYGTHSELPCILTFDISDQRSRVANDQFFRNVVNFDPFTDASEIFVPKRNGLYDYILTDGKGNFQRVAPPNIVCDYTKPDGFTHELEMGMSCVACHFGNSGFNVARNDWEILLRSDFNYEFDRSYIDKAGKKAIYSKTELVDFLTHRYARPIYEADDLIGRAERDFVKTISSITHYEVKAPPEPNAVQQVGKKIIEIYHNYRYRRIGPEQICLELGVKVAPEQAVAVLQQLVPAPPKGKPEDVMISLVRAGASIKRDDMDAIYAEMARRAVITRPTLFKEVKKDANANTRVDRFGVYAIAG